MRLRIIHRPWLARPYVIEERDNSGKTGVWRPTGCTASNETEARALIERFRTEKVIAEFDIE